MSCVDGEYDNCCKGSLASHSAVVMPVPFKTAEMFGAETERHVGGDCMLVMELAAMTKSSFSFDPRPQGNVWTVAPGVV